MPHKSVEARRAYATRYRAAHRKQIAGYQARWIARNVESVQCKRSIYNTSAKGIAKQARYRVRNVVKIRHRNAAYEISIKGRANKALYRTIHIENVRLTARRWVRNHRAQCNALLAKYRADKKRATPRWADAKAIQCIYRRAAYLQQKTGVRHDVDHVIPLVNAQVCGLHVVVNLQILTARANQQKGNRFE